MLVQESVRCILYSNFTNYMIENGFKKNYKSFLNLNNRMLYANDYSIRCKFRVIF